MATLQSLTINDTGSLTLPLGTSGQRLITPTVVTFNTTPGGSAWTVPADVSTVSVLVVAGGGGGGSLGGGGGAGGLIFRSNFAVTAGASVTVTVGAGGTGASAAATAPGTQGGNSQFSSLTAIGGGGGTTNYTQNNNVNGGSGGGAGNGADLANNAHVGGTATEGQGYPGGGNLSSTGGSHGGGGGGAGGPGSPGGLGSSAAIGRGGGPGLYFSISGASVAYAGGGGGGARSDGAAVNAYPGGLGGIGGGGAGGGCGGNGTAGTANTGGGGGGGGYNGSFGAGADGGTGVVIVSYFTNTQLGILRTHSESKVAEVLTPQHGSISNEPTFNEGTGGTTNYFGGWKYHHYYNTTSTFTPAQTGLVDLLIVAGGGGGGGNPTAGAGMAGGGGGGVIELCNYPVTGGTAYTVVAGTGGAGFGTSTYGPGTSGTNSRFGNVIAIGGGGGGGYSSGAGNPGRSGGSGGGGGTREPYSSPCYPGMGTRGQGYRGGRSEIVGGPWVSAGGGGAGGVGGDATAGGPAGSGGSGKESGISGVHAYYGAGGGGSTYNVQALATQAIGGNGGGGNGELGPGRPGMPGTGGGGGGGGTNATNNGAGGNGGNGIVIVRYRYNTAGTGSSSATAAPSARDIKHLTGTATDGLYSIMIPQVGSQQVYCDMNTAGGGWMHAGTFSDNGEAVNNANHIWGAPLNPQQDTGIWEDYTTVGTQSFTANYKNNVWNYMPFREILMKDSGGTLRNIWRTKIYNSTPNGNCFNSLSHFFSRLRWMATGSDTTTAAGALAGGYPFQSSGRCVTWDIINFGVSDPIFQSSSRTRILFKWGEYNLAQDSNKDRSMISHEGEVNVDVPKGIGTFSNLSGTITYRNITPTANAGDTPPNSITGTHNLTIWVR